MPLYEFKCTCGKRVEEFFMVKEEKRCRCIVCGEMMQRVYTPPAVRPNGIKRTPAGAVELGTEYPSVPAPRDRFENAEHELAQVIEQAPDLDGSGDCELSKLNA